MAMLFAVNFTATAQQLKPTEIIYSRLPPNPHTPPTSANTSTIWAVGQDGSNDRQITTGWEPRISDDGRFLLFKRNYPTGAYFDPFDLYFDVIVREIATGQETLIYHVGFNNALIGYSFSPDSNRADVGCRQHSR